MSVEMEVASQSISRIMGINMEEQIWFQSTENKSQYYERLLKYAYE